VIGAVKLALAAIVGALVGFVAGVVETEEENGDLRRLRAGNDCLAKANRRHLDATEAAENVIRGLLRAPRVSESDRTTDIGAAQDWLDQFTEKGAGS
jgi:hypothetical protein